MAMFDRINSLITRNSPLGPLREVRRQRQISPPGTIAVDEIINSLREESKRYARAAYVKKPWERRPGKVDWPDWRVKAGKVLMSQQFEGLMACIIMTNVAFIILEADQAAKCYPHYYENEDNCPDNSRNVWWLVLSNRIFLAVYCTEATISLLTFRKSYFENRWNCLDFFVVSVSVFSEIVDGMINVAYMRMLRIARLMRAFRIILSIRELYMLISGLGSSIKAMFFGTMMLLSMLVVWSIILVEFVHPVNSRLEYDKTCPRCPHAYRTVAHSTLTLFQQIVAGDSWGTPSVRIIEERPILACLLILVVVTVSLGVMNLILAVIVESAAEARERDTEEKNKLKQNRLLDQKIKLLRLCANMDTDFSGSLNLEELYHAWDESRDFREVMLSLDVQKSDLFGIFQILDPEKTGDVDYKVFVDSLYSLSTGDPRMSVSLTKMEVESTRKFVENVMAPKVEATAKMMEAQRKTLEEQGELLRELTRDRQEQRLAALAVSSKELAEPGAKAKSGEEGEAEPPGSSEPPSAASEPKLVTDITTQIADLRHYLVELSNVKSEIMRKAEEQEAALVAHAEILMSVHASLANPPGGGESKLQSVGKQVVKLRQHFRERLEPALQELERQIDKEASAVRGGGLILDAVAAELRIPPPAPHENGRRRLSGRCTGSILTAHGAGPEATPPPDTGPPAPFLSPSGSMPSTPGGRQTSMLSLRGPAAVRPVSPARAGLASASV